MAGFFRSNLRTTAGGIEKLAFAFSRGVLDAADILDPQLALAVAVHDLPPIADMPIPALPDGHQMWVVPGFVNLTVVDGIRQLWSRLPGMLGALSEAGIDVIVDLGRLGIDDPRLPLLDSADRVLVCATSSMVDMNRAYRRLQMPDLNERTRGGIDGQRYWMLLNSPPAEEISPQDFANHVLPVIGILRRDPDGAAVFSHGRPDPKPNRNVYRGGIRRAVQDLQSLADRQQDRTISA
ncbi:hypothetical protein [Microbacterium testaceum]|uniref:hypothetical protein n=1 Tax=Microbacterium testaceum TaxID=2033 RepID=UPI002AC7B338|nr:hypothetical protein [Microbacterium testaceum]MDZ5146345.1 hypothetical protein [Microbacterium testaceum]